jgi:hypothetical protein
MTALFGLLITSFLLLIPGFATGQLHTHADSSQKVGDITFPISCSHQAQEDVEHGIAMFHSFLFDNAESQFKAAAEADPSCAMAFWAQAIGLYRPLAYLPSDADMKRGWELVQTAEHLTVKTPRERDYLHTAEVLYRPDTRNYVTRNHDYSAELERIYTGYTDDIEAAVFYALSVLTYADSNDRVENWKKALVILNPIFAAHPNHPGVAHYIIHAADNPQLAQQGLAAARKYAQIAPQAPHALHMPSHIFARLGLWQEDIQSNLDSLHAAKRSPVTHAENQLHAMEFLIYAYLQIGNDATAEHLITAQRRIPNDQVDSHLHEFVYRTFANSPALYALETRNWKAAEALKPDMAAEPYNQAITYWAHAIAAGHMHDLRAAQRAVDEYDAMIEKTKNGPKPRVAENMTAGHDEAHAWLLLLRGKTDEATDLLRKVADKQDLEGKGEVEIPAREMLADMLMELNRPGEALEEYERSMKTDPNRFNGVYGAGKAAELIGQHAKERQYYGKLISNCKAQTSPKSRRLELTHAAQALQTSH